MDLSRQERERARGKEGRSNESERRENSEKESTGVNGMAVVWKNVRKMTSRERQSEIMDWIERNKCDICAVNETGLTGLMQWGYKFSIVSGMG